MQLPGQLKNTTLGDLLGALHRDGASGVLELIERDGHRHCIELRDGEIEQVETERGGPLLGDLLQIDSLPEIGDDHRLGETLLQQGVVTPTELADALHRQNLARLEPLFHIKRASVRFHAPRPLGDDPTAPTRLNRSEFLDGRPRHRTRESAPDYPATRRQTGALQVLGLPDEATSSDIRRAFRELAQEHHPDRHPEATPQERQLLFRRFAEISRAYHTLTS